MSKNAHIAVVPSPGPSNLIGLVQFAKRLVEQHPDLHVTFFVPTLGPPNPSMKATLNSLPPNIDSTILPQVNEEDLPPNLYAAAKIILTVKHSLPSLHEALSSLHSSTHLVAVVFDLFSTVALDFAKEFNLLSYVFYTSGAVSLSFFLSLPKIDESVSTNLQDLESVNVPGVARPFQVKELPDQVLHERSSQTYQSFLGICKKLSLVDGVIVNTFTDLEPEVIAALQEKAANKIGPCVYPVGPIIQTESSNPVNKSECLTWLDNQPPKSVLYISFGTGGTFSEDQLNEFAFGLELSGHKFLWAVRVPNKSASSGYLKGEKDDPLQYLPSGFLDRTKGQGLVVPSWAPQIEILRHESTAGFVTHCGWNSVLEGVVHAVPMIAWPLFGEQTINAVTLTEVLKITLRPKADETGIVRREEVAEIIKRIIEGDEGVEIRKRIKDLSEVAAAALSEHGSSKKEFSSLALKWKSI